MSTIANPAQSATLPELPLPATRPNSVGNVLAIASVVIRELCRRKDFYVLFVLTALITLVMGSVTFFNQDKVARYLKEICLFLIWASSLVIAITTAARQIPMERENRTLFPLLAKPVTRHQIVVGKFLGCWLATGFTLAVFYLFFGVVAGVREHEWPILNYVQGASLHWVMLGVVCALTMLGSVIFAAPSSNTTIVLVLTVASLLVGRHLNKVALSLAEPGQTLLYAVYYVIPHLELFDVRDLIIHNWGVIPWHIWVAAVVYGAVYMVLFLALACLAFRRKAVR
jgi:Cu-processing system permease protein